MSLLIKNGLVLTATGAYKGDVYVEKESISAIGSNLSNQYGKESCEIVDAKEKYILPGGILIFKSQVQPIVIILVFLKVFSSLSIFNPIRS